MPTSEPRQLRRRTGHLEILEARHVMSSSPLVGQHAGDIQHQSFFDPPDVVNGGELEHHLASAHGQSRLIDVRNDYGLVGTGQTVAIIDSGVAYDHAALGGGLGAAFRVVGGRDFTGEQDNNPYDDGSAGSHGTHVAGILAANGGTVATSGVALGVDLVALRVFDDVGEGYFDWVEDALQWIHNNRNAFANPITTVNLSIGTDYNGAAPPGWTMLEDEFAQLKADGIFIAVSAGNGFEEYNVPGLSYPAASPYVVPVMATDDDGRLSDFSQRHQRAIAAPGRWIVSTVPDYVGNHNGLTDDWASFSGTSMAAPYLAGASVLVREAMEFVGRTGINQDAIYDHIRTTADVVYDALTSTSYRRLNLQAAIDALMPGDDYGSTVATAHVLEGLGAPAGNVQQTSHVAGLIGTLGDVDYFTFTAGASGTVTFTAATTHGLAAAWQVSGAAGAVGGDQGETVAFDVAAGQTYAVGLGTSGGIGYYDLSISLEPAFEPVDLGTVAFANHVGLDNSSGQSWYRMEAANAGTFTVEVLFNAAAGDVDLQAYDAQMNLVASSNSGEGHERLEVLASAGDVLYVRIVGANSSVDLRLTNLVQHIGTTVYVAGTAGDDQVRINFGQTHSLVVNDVTYSFAPAAATHFDVQAGGGFDRLELSGTAANDSAVLRVGQLSFTGSGVSVTAGSFEWTFLVGGGGIDRASFYDSAANDLYQSWPQVAAMFNSAYYNRADGFTYTYAYSTAGGYDEARMYDSAGKDLYQASSAAVAMHNSTFYNWAGGFEYARGFATADGYDEARIYDTPGNDLYLAWAHLVALRGAGFFNTAEGFELTRGMATGGGRDEARFYDTPGDDLFVAQRNLSWMSGAARHWQAEGFDVVQAFASAGGYDQARFYDSVGDDLYRTYAGDAIMSGSGYWHRAHSFDVTIGHSTAGGYDELQMYDSPGNDMFMVWPDKASMSGPGIANWAGGFERTRGFATRGGYDEVRMYDSVHDDLFRTWRDRSIMNGPGFQIEAEGFENQRGFSTAGGNDQARFYDTPSSEHVIARIWGALLEGGAYRAQAVGFASITADGTAGGFNTRDVDAVDWAFQLVGQWL
jgi:subtilisin family serine protease